MARTKDMPRGQQKRGQWVKLWDQAEAQAQVEAEAQASSALPLPKELQLQERGGKETGGGGEVS